MKKLILLSCSVALISLIGCGKKTDTKKNETVPDTTKKEEVKNEKLMTGTLSMSKTEVEPGAEITVDYKTEGTMGSNAWIGLIPSNIEHGSEAKNDENDLSFQYLNDKTGTMTFIVPSDTGKFDFRLNSSDNNGKELASVTFRIKGSSNNKTELSTNKTSYAIGEQMVITFKAIPTWEKQAWIGIVPASTKHGQAAEADLVDIGYVYIDGRSKGTWKFKAPYETGSYSVRMFDAYAGKEVKSIDFKVQ